MSQRNLLSIGQTPAQVSQRQTGHLAEFFGERLKSDGDQKGGMEGRV